MIEYEHRQATRPRANSNSSTWSTTPLDKQTNRRPEPPGPINSRSLVEFYWWTGGDQAGPHTSCLLGDLELCVVISDRPMRRQKDVQSSAVVHPCDATVADVLTILSAV